MKVSHLGSVAQDDPYGVLAGRRVSRLVCVAVLAMALLGSMLLLLGSPQHALAAEEQVNCATLTPQQIETLKKEENLAASEILVRCGVLPGGSPTGPPGSSAHSSVLGPSFPGNDVDVITGTETYPHVTQSESVVWSNGNTVVVNYNDSKGIEETPRNLSGVSVSKNGGETFTRLGPPSPLTGHEINKGDPILVYDVKLGKWFAGDLVSGCGGKGIGVWTSTNGETWTVGACAHNGTGDDRDSMWIDNNSASPFYGRMYVSFNNFTSGGALEVTHSDDGVTWSTPVTLSPGSEFRRNIQLSGSPGSEGIVFLVGLNEGTGGVGSAQQDIGYRSSNGGVTWTSKAIDPSYTVAGNVNCGFAAVTPIWRAAGWGQPAVGPGGVLQYDYATHGEGSDEGDIYYVRSTNNGETWSTPVRLSTDATGKAQWQPSLRVSPSGVVEATWYDRRNSTNGENYQRFARVSTNDGVTWGPDEPLETTLIPQPTQPDPEIVACYAGDYNYTTANAKTGFDTWTDGRVSIEGKPVEKVFFHSIPLQNPPTVTTGSATGVTEKEATLHGTVNPEGAEAKYYFEYGTTKSFGSKTAEASAGSGTTNVEVSKVLASLTGGTTYFYRIVATNTGGTSFGAEKTFETTAKPTVETKPATSVGETTAKLNGSVNPKGAETKYYFEYGTTESYGSKTAEASAGSGFSNVEVSKEITGLLRNTTYDFRIVATNIDGTTDGANQKFTTLSSVITGSATGITATEAVVHGTINPHGLATTDQFEYGLTTSYGTIVPVPAESAGSGTTVLGKGYILTGLQPSTTYHFRLVGINSEGTTDGKDATFTTGALSAQFVSAFGSEGTGNGQFKEPTGIGVNPINGNVVVSDEKNNRVQVFTEKDEFVRAFGIEGSGNGQFKEPRGVAVDSKGNIWVTDTGNNRVEEFNEKGEYLSQFGTVGTGNGQFTSPKGLAVDAKGNIWVADSGNNRVEEFNEKREYVRQFAAGTNPIGVATDAKGNVWSDNEDETGAIEEHNEKGELLQKFATRGSGNGQVLDPKRLTVAYGGVWVPNAGNNRVDVFNEKGEYVTKFGTAGSEPEQMKDPTGIAVDTHGRIWVADDENNRVDRWRISVLRPTFSSSFGSFGTGNGQFDEPTGIGVNPINGTLAVSDEKNNRVQEFTEKGEFVRTFGTEGTGNGQFKEPRGVAVDSKGNIWVTDTGNNRVEEFNEKGEYLAQFGTTGTGNGQFTSPKGLAVDSKGNIWVADSGNNRVEEFNEKREYVRQFVAGTNPIGVAVDSKGNVWSDNEDETGAIEEHNEKGELLQKFATRGSGNGQVLDPKRLAIDTAGDLWVPNAGNNRVDVFNEKGEYVTKFGTAGSEPEQMKDPTGIAVDHSGNVWVADDENNRVDKWIR